MDEYVVQAGDTIFGVAKKLGISTTELVKLNPTLASSWGTLKVGGKLKSPAKGNYAGIAAAIGEATRQGLITDKPPKDRKELEKLLEQSFSGWFAPSPDSGGSTGHEWANQIPTSDLPALSDLDDLDLDSILDDIADAPPEGVLDAPPVAFPDPDTSTPLPSPSPVTTPPPEVIAPPGSEPGPVIPPEGEFQDAPMDLLTDPAYAAFMGQYNLSMTDINELRAREGLLLQGSIDTQLGTLLDPAADPYDVGAARSGGALGVYEDRALRESENVYGGRGMAFGGGKKRASSDIVTSYDLEETQFEDQIARNRQGLDTRQEASISALNYQKLAEEQAARERINQERILATYG